MTDPAQPSTPANGATTNAATAPAGAAPASTATTAAAPQSVAASPAVQSPAASSATTAAEGDAGKVRAQLHRVLVGTAVRDIARELGAHNPDDVLALTAGDFEVNERDEVVVRGDPRTTPKDHLAKALAARAYMLKPAMPSGAGASAQVAAPVAGAAPDVRTPEGATTWLRGATLTMFGIAPNQATPNTGR